MNEFEIQVRRLVAAEDIRELLYSYARCADDADNERMVGLFVDDCTASFAPEQLLVGKVDLLAWLRSIQSSIYESSHFMSNISVLLDGVDRAISHSYLYSFGRRHGHPEVTDKHRWCRYENTYRLTSSGWRIQTLTLRASAESGGPGPTRSGEVRGAFVWPPDLPGTDHLTEVD